MDHPVADRWWHFTFDNDTYILHLHLTLYTLADQGIITDLSKNDFADRQKDRQPIYNISSRPLNLHEIHLHKLCFI